MNFAPFSTAGTISVWAMLHSVVVLPTAVPTTHPQPGTATLTTYATSTGQICVESNPVAEIRRITGLTFDQLATLFDVTRRTVHLWMSGQRMLPGKQEQVQRILATVRRVDRGSPDLTRAALLDDGARLFDLIAKGELATVEARLAALPAKRQPLPPNSRRRRAGESAPSPADLVRATQEGPHPAVRGGTRIKSMKATKLPRGK